MVGILHRMVMEGLSDLLTFELRCEEGEGENYANIRDCCHRRREP